MDRIDILKEIDRLRDQLVEKYKPEKIILFGSSLSDDTDINDVDLLIIKDGVPHYGDERIKELYRLISANIAVDYLVYKPSEVEERLSLGDPFFKQIFKEGKVLYG